MLRLFWFSVSGLIGFLVDASVLYMLKDVFGLYGARLVSFLSAVAATWLFNRTITFKDRASGRSAGHEFLLYFSLMVIGGSVNYGLYALLVHEQPFVATYPITGVAAGSLAGMLINLLTSRYLLFKLSRVVD